MKSTFSRRNVLQVVGAGIAGVALPSMSQSAWPTKPIRLIVPYTAGGFTDQMARLVQLGLQKQLGEPIVVENKPGANSIIGVDAVAKAAPDGHTFGVVIPAFTANTTLYPKLPYNPQKDLMGVSVLGISPLVAAASSNAPFKNAKELVAYTKANPGKVSFASSGIGSAAHLTTELFKTLTKTFMVHIPYKGAAPALAALMGGQVQLFLDPPPNLVQPAQAGRIQLIGVASEKRLPILPNVPTFVEQNMPEMLGSTWASIIAPAGTPADIVKRMSEAVNQVIQSPEIRAKLEIMGTFAEGTTPQACDAFLASETKKWGKVIKDAGVTLE